MGKGEKVLGAVLAGLTAMAGVVKIVSDVMGHKQSDLGCDWYCDYCNGYLNEQPGFTTITGTWTCTECGGLNDVSMRNIVPEGVEEFTPHFLEEIEDPDDY